MLGAMPCCESSKFQERSGPGTIFVKSFFDDSDWFTSVLMVAPWVGTTSIGSEQAVRACKMHAPAIPATSASLAR